MKCIYNILYINIFCLCLFSCIAYDHENEVIDDNIYFENIIYSEEISRYGIIKKTSFDENDTILFHSYGNHPNKGMLIYNGKEWNSTNKLKWNSNSRDSIHYIAFYPVSYNNRYSENGLYNNGMLKDILLCKAGNKYKEKISLKFKHIFSILNLDFNKLSEVDDIQSIDVSIPAIIDSIETQSGKIHINKNKSTHFTLQIDTNKCCRFIVPPIKNLTVNIRLNATGISYEKEIENIIYEEGRIYTYNIIKKDKSKGIKTAEDFIAFSYLINGIEYKDRNLDEFYYTENEKRVFSLLNNITFTEGQCQQLKIIGTDKKKFDDIFDGKLHTISKLIISDISSRNALFKYIGEKGIVKNLIFEDSKVYASNKNENAMLACRNYGTIDNCMINRCELKSSLLCSCSFIVYNNIGTIINSKVCNSSLEGIKSSSCSVIANTQKGTIINCYSSDNFLSFSSSSIVSGFVYNPLKNSEIRNCYVRCTSDKKEDIYCYSYYSDEYFVIDNCFMNDKFPANNSNKYNSYFKIYNSSFRESSTGKDVVDMLNEWIDNNQEKYPQYIFKRWKKNSDLIRAEHIE